MKANDDKCPDGSAVIQIENATPKCSKVKKLLGVHIDYKLKFDIHVETICKKAHRKLSVLSRITNYMELPKRRILMNAFFKAQFNYCPNIWMFHSRCLNNKILLERCLRLIYNDRISNSEELLNKSAESASYLGPKIWEQIPAEIKNKDSLDGFKKEIKKMETYCLS